MNSHWIPPRAAGSNEMPPGQLQGSVLLPFLLFIDLALELGPNVGLHHERQPRPERRHGLLRTLYDIEGLVPRTFKFSEDMTT